MTDKDFTTKLKSLTRQRIRLTWQLAQMGAPLSDEDRRMIEVIRAHPEYADLWDRLDQLSDAEIERDGTDPILHVTVHQTVENQIATGDPPETAQTVEALMQAGLSRHEAVHRVGSVVLEEVWHVMREKRPFDRPRFVGKLAELLEPRAPRPRSPARSPRRRPGRRR
jgi:hypothetical protein